jgi:putative FmdB family regulatory protein
MPIYEYQCQKCGHRSEALQKLNDPPLLECAACGGTLRRLVSAPSFQFKGSGWYVTDYAGKGGAPPDAGASASETPAANGTKPSNAGEKSGEKSGEKAGEKNREPASGASSGPASRPGSGTP